MPASFIRFSQNDEGDHGFRAEELIVEPLLDVWANRAADVAFSQS
jgi:hypothetical protein